MAHLITATFTVSAAKEQATKKNSTEQANETTKMTVTMMSETKSNTTMQTQKKGGMKGYVYTLEVLLAVGMIFVALVFIFRFSPPTPAHDLTIIKRSGMEVMEYMDQYYHLRKWVSEFNEAAIESTINSLLPNNIKFEAEICTDECNAAGVPAKKAVVAADYYVQAYRDEYLGRKVRLWLWR